jgi:parvulin-like peptidyl-prolyl isomerase
MKPKGIFVLLLLFAPAVLPAEVLNRIVLRVNEQIATLYDYQQRRQELVRDITRREQDPEERRRLLEQAGEIVYANLYQELLLRSRAEQLGIEVTEAEVDAAVARIRENFQIRTDQEFAAALAQSGMTEGQLREQLRGQIRMQEVRGREIAGRVQIDEDDLRRAYRKNAEQFRQPEQLQLREVVVLDEGGLPTAEERARVAAEIRQAVAAGTSLADAAKEHAAKGATSNVIDLGWVSPGDLDPALEAAIWKLPAGSVSEPVPARGGLHLVQVVERRESRIPPFSEVVEALRAREQDRVFQEEMTKYMDELEKRSLIVTDPPPEAAGFRRRIETGGGEATGGELEGLTDVGTGATAPATAPGEPVTPGTLPEPKPVNATPPPVATPTNPAAAEPPPPADPPADPPGV